MSVLVNNFTNIWTTWIEFSRKYYRGSCDGAIVFLYSNRIYVFIYNIGLVLLGNINFINFFKDDLGFVQEINRIRLSLKTKQDEVTYQHLKSESL